MASASSLRGVGTRPTQGDAVGAAGAKSPTLDRLVQRAVTADSSGRSAFAAALWKRAAAVALETHGDTLIYARCKLEQASSLTCQMSAETSSDVQAAQLAEVWALTISVIPLILRRMDASTLLPGRCAREEVLFFKQFIVWLGQANLRPELEQTILVRQSFAVGYDIAMKAAHTVLTHLLCDVLPTALYRLDDFLLRVVDLMQPASRGLQGVYIIAEQSFANSCSEAVEMSTHPFVHALREKWTTPSMVAMRSERGMDNSFAAAMREGAQEFDDAQRADIEAHGLKTCSYPPCDKQEATVQQYKFCSACRSAWYCSAEHGALHWKEHKPTCRATTDAAKEAAAARV